MKINNNRKISTQSKTSNRQTLYGIRYYIYEQVRRIISSSPN